MQKHPDFHFGKDAAEIFFKFLCWTISLIVIAVTYSNDTNEVFGKSLAVSVLAFSLSCLTNIGLSIRDKKEKFAKIIYVIPFIGFLITTFTSFSMATLDCKFYSKDHCLYHLYYFTFIVILILIDFCIVYSDLDKISEQEIQQQKAYNKGLQGK